MELKKRALRYYESVFTHSAQKEESAEAIVPDNSPDIERIVMATGLACLKEKTARDGRLELSGVVKVAILYIPEGIGGLRKMEVNLPFSHAAEDPAFNGDVHIKVNPTLLTADGKLLNPRKVQASVSLLLDIETLSPCEWEICESIEDAGADGLQMLTDSQSAYMTIAAKSKDFTVTDEVELPGSKPPIAEVLALHVHPIARDIKAIGNKLVFKGAAVMKLCYCGPDEGDTPGPVACFEQELPFSQIIEMDGLEDSCDCDVSLHLTGIELDIRTGSSLDARILGITLHMDAAATASAERHVETLTDLYSTTKICKPAFKPYRFKQLTDVTTKHMPVREIFETGIGVHTVIDTQVALTPPLLRHDEEGRRLTCEANVKALYRGDDMGWYSTVRRLSVALPIDGDGDIDAKAVLSGDIFGAGTSDGMEIRFGVDFELKATRDVEIQALESVELEAEAEASDRRPSVVLRRASGGERLWGLAKRYRTTGSEIQNANRLDDDEIPAGKLLLIPKKR
jgi:hypothetical protein